MFRFFEDFSTIYFLPSFYLNNFSHMKGVFSTLNASIQSFGGMISILASGVIADRWSKRRKRAGADLAIINGFIGIPAMAGTMLLFGGGFYTSMFFLALKFLLTEGYMAPTISMMQATVKPEEQGSIVSAYLCFLTIAGCASTVLLGWLCHLCGAQANPAIYGKLIFLFSFIGFAGSIPSFNKAGKAYEDFLRRKFEPTPQPEAKVAGFSASSGE